MCGDRSDVVPPSTSLAATDAPAVRPVEKAARPLVTSARCFNPLASVVASGIPRSQAPSLAESAPDGLTDQPLPISKLSYSGPQFVLAKPAARYGQSACSSR